MAAVGVERIEDKTRWTKALGEAAMIVYGDCTEDIELCKHSSAVDHEDTGQHLSASTGCNRLVKRHREPSKEDVK